MLQPAADEPDPDFEKMRTQALTLGCPRCGAAPEHACQSFHGRLLPNLRDDRPGIHTERLNAARGLPTREDRSGRPWL